MLLEDVTYIDRYGLNSDEHHISFQIVYDVVKLGLPLLSQKLGAGGIAFPKSLSN